MTTTTTKMCARCQNDLPLDNFGDAPRMKLGKKSYCRPCYSAWAKERYHQDPETARAKNRERSKRYRNSETNRSRHLKAMYGITRDQYDVMLATQGGRCAICQTDTPGGRGDWHVDHDHSTGHVRALLCAGCNVGIALLGEDSARIRAAAEYLDFHRGSTS